MEELEHILNGTNSTLERALLLEGRRYNAPDAVRLHALAAVGVVASVGVGAGLLAWFSAKSLIAKLVLALSTATVLSALPITYVLSTRDKPAPQDVPASAAVVAPTPAEPAAPVPVMDTPAVARALPPTRAAAPRTSPANDSALRAELAALDAIRSALAQDDPAGALSSVAAYFRAFPRGRLRLEAEVLRIDVLAKAGRTQNAKRLAQKFIGQHPHSVLTARVRPFAEP